MARYRRQHAHQPKPAHATLDAHDTSTVSKPAHATLDATTASQDATPTPTPTAGRLSDGEPWRAVIQAKRARGLSTQRSPQDRSAQHGFVGSYYSVRRCVRHLEAIQELPFRRLQCVPGEEAQVEFGSGAPLRWAEGSRRRTHVFRIVLSHARKGSSAAVTRPSTADFLRCLANACGHCGGVTQRLVLDNLHAAVTKADGYDPDRHPTVRSFGPPYGVVLLPTRPYTPPHQGKVERGIDDVHENALKGRTFASLDEPTHFLLDGERSVADTRLHGTTRRQVGRPFARAERPALPSLPPERFPCFQEARRTVHRDGHIDVERVYYAVPPEYLARRVWTRWDGRLVRIFHDRLEQIAVPVRHEAGRFRTQPQPIRGPKISGVERGCVWLLGQVRRRGPHRLGWAEALIPARGVEGVRVRHGLLNLAHRHACAAIERAWDIALSHDAFRLRTLHALIDPAPPRQESWPFLDTHAVIRQRAEYDPFVQDAFHKEVGR